MIEITAECDGPECWERKTVPATNVWPSMWIVLAITQAATANVCREYGFCGMPCLEAWAKVVKA
jgi:hypothetical protein